MKPMGYAGRQKYDRPGRAARYAQRSEKRNREEWALLSSLLEQLPAPPASALDAPCGTGRIAEHLLAAGIPTWAADLSPAMCEATRVRLGRAQGFGGVKRLDLEQPAGSGVQPADLVICLRFLHHLPDRAHRLRVLQSLAHLTRGHLILSFHHPLSWHNARRAVRRLFTGRRGDRHTIWPATLAGEAAEAGLAWIGCRALAPYRREFWLALLAPRRVGCPGS